MKSNFSISITIISGFVLLTLPIVQIGFCQICPWPTRSKEGEFAVRRTVNAPHFAPSTTITFKCRDGQQLVQKAPLVCQADGRWKGDWQGCRPATTFDDKNRDCKKGCDAPKKPQNGFIIMPGIMPNSFHNGDTVEFGCNPGLYMSLGAPRITCDNGAWIGVVPICQDNNPYQATAVGDFCPLLSYSLDHVNVTATNLQPAAFTSVAVPNFVVGTRITFMCANGLRLGGRREITCLKSGRWSGRVPSCIEDEPPLTCPIPPPAAPPNSVIVGAETITRRAFLPGSFVEYRCLPGFVRIGYDQIYCRRDGTWSSASMAMRCAPRTTTTIATTTTKPLCPPVQSRLMGRNDRDILRVVKLVVAGRNADMSEAVKPVGEGSQAVFACPATHRMRGDSRLVCLNGRWEGDMASCELLPTTTPVPQCPSLQDVVNKAGPRSLVLQFQLAQPIGGRRIKAGEPGSTYNFLCPPTHDLVGDRRLICVEGRWIGEIPDCQAKPTTPDPCSMIPQPGPHMILAERANRTAIYACDRGYQMQGHGTLTCTGAKWVWKGKAKPTCIKRKAACRPPQHEIDKRDDIDISQDVWVCIAVDVNTQSRVDQYNRGGGQQRLSASAFANAFANVEAGGKRSDSNNDM